jgi:hypothetical protein
MKTQIFTEQLKQDLQLVIDRFFANHKITELIDIKFSVSDIKGYSAMIIYKT